MGLSPVGSKLSPMRLLQEPLNDEQPRAQRVRPPCLPTETTVLVAVRAPRVREALIAMLGALDDFCVVADAGSHEEAIALARATRPVLALVDQDLPPCGGGWTVEVLSRECLAPAIVAIGLRADDAIRARARSAGAHAFVQTGATPAELEEALKAALRDYAAATAN